MVMYDSIEDLLYAKGYVCFALVAEVLLDRSA